MCELKQSGRLLSNISDNEYFAYNEGVSFEIQRVKQTRMGASEVGSLFSSESDLRDLIINRVLKQFNKYKGAPMNLAMKKGKANEYLGFSEFSEIYKDEYKEVIPNKYVNGIDMFSYTKQYKHYKLPVCATIDGFAINNKGKEELIEVKYTDSDYLQQAIDFYNDVGNFISNKYFFKYYIQCQFQLACTGLDICNLVFLIGQSTKVCVIKRDEDILDKVFERVKEFLACINEVIGFIKLEMDPDELDYYNTDNKDKNYLRKLVRETDFYLQNKSLDYVDQFISLNKNQDYQIEELLKAQNHSIEEFDIEIQQINAYREDIRKTTFYLREKIKQHNVAMREHLNKILIKYRLNPKKIYKYKDVILRLDMNKVELQDIF